MAETGSAFDGLHRRNLSKVLRLLHQHVRLSRAQITAATGLNRSTVASLVAELVELGLAVESSPDATKRVGRPSPMVSAGEGVAVIAVNPEIDAVTLGAVGLDGRVLVRQRVEVDHYVSPEETAEIISGTLARWRRGALRGVRVTAVGIAVPGLVRILDGLVRWAPHLGWRDAPLRELVESTVGLPTVVGNDASLGALAEHLFGAGRGVDDLVYLNGGASGIGGGLVVGGSMVGGSGGYAGEFGQNRPGIASSADRRAPEGVLEDEVSRARLLEVAGLASADEPTLALALERSGDPGVAAELSRQRRILATALSNAVNVLNPSTVVLGGFLATIASADMAELADAVAAQAVPAAFEGVEIVVAALGEDRLLIGAAEAALQDLLDDPAGEGSRSVETASAGRLDEPASLSR